MRKEWIQSMAVLLLAASSVQAQSNEEVAGLQKQLDELSAKLAGMEKKSAENKLPDWVKSTKFKGDFRYRYEKIEEDSKNYKDRQRVRLRVGAYGEVNDFADYGVRLATGGDSATSANQDIGGGTKKEVRLDQYYVDLHPELLGGVHLLLGKMPQPWLDRTGLIWDGDLNPEGIVTTYKTVWTNGFNLMANAGSYVLSEEKGDDIQLWAGQLAAEMKAGSSTVRLGLSDFYYHNAEDKGAGAGLTSGANTAGTGFNLVEGFGTIGFSAGIPVTFKGQYVINTEAENRDDKACLVGVTLGNAKKKGDWEVGYDWRDTGNDAVPDGFNDSDFAYGVAGSYGHSVFAKYQVAKNIQAAAAYMLAVNNKGQDLDTVQLDLNFKF